MGIVIDTSAMIALERSRASRDAILEEAGEEPVILPPIVWGELMAGVHLADSVPRRVSEKITKRIARLCSAGIRFA